MPSCFLAGGCVIILINMVVLAESSQVSRSTTYQNMNIPYLTCHHCKNLSNLVSGHTSSGTMS